MAEYDLTEEDSPFQKFLSHKHGLKSFQPTLIWKVVFSRYTPDDNIIFTDNVTVPGEKVSTTQAETFIGDIVYPLSERRSTGNTLTIGLYVDIYATLETTIVNDIKYFSRNGIKRLKNDYKQHIELLGYRMKGKDDSTSTGTYNRTCYVKYAFENCIPMSIDEYTYDQNNDKWGRTRNVTFVFSDYSIESINKELMEAEEYTKFFDNAGSNITGILDKYTRDGYIINSEVKPRIGKEQMAKFVQLLKQMTTKPKESNFYVLDAALEMKQFIREHGINDSILHEILDTMAHDNDRSYFTLFDDEDTPEGSEFYKRIKTKLKSEADRAELARILSQIDVPVVKSKFYEYPSYDPFDELWWDDNRDTPSLTNVAFYSPNGMYKLHGDIHDKNSWSNIGTREGNNPRDNLVVDIVKTAVKKYLIPDTPMYHGLMSPVSKLIRKVQQWFYAEPKHKTTPQNDRPTVDSHTDGHRIRINDEDYTTMNTHGRNASIQRIDDIDYTTVTSHAKPPLAEIDPDDHTMILEHQEGNRVEIDPNDYTVQNGHTEADLADIDPNDYTIQTEHSNANVAVIDPYDYTTQLTHNYGNRAYIDPNDYTTHDSHASIGSVKIDQNDFTSLNDHGSVDIKTADSNDSIFEHQNQPDLITPPKYDMLKKHEINETDLKKIDKNDYIKQKNHKEGNIIPINNKDYLEKDKHQDANLVNINEKDFLEKGKHEPANEITVNDKDAPNTDTHNNVNQIETDGYDTATLYETDKNVVQVGSNPAMEFKTKDIIANTNDSVMTFSDKDRNEVVINTNNAMTFDAEKQNIVKNDDVSSVDSSKIKIEKIKEFFGNKTPTHDDNGKMIDVDQMDSPNLSEIKIDEHKTDSSFVDFAKMIIKEVKHNENSSIGDHDKTFAHILKRPNEPQAVEMVNRKTGNIVLVHDTDHTELT